MISRPSLILWTAGELWLIHHLALSNEHFTLTTSWSEINEHSDRHWPLSSQQGGAFSFHSDSKRSHEAGIQTLMEPTLFSGQPADVNPIRSYPSQPTPLCLSIRPAATLCSLCEGKTNHCFLKPGATTLTEHTGQEWLQRLLLGAFYWVFFLSQIQPVFYLSFYFVFPSLKT